MEIENFKEIRVLLVGKTGSGKSSVGNQLIESKVFKVGRNYGTKQSQLERRTIEDGRELVIVDTPGYCNIHLTEEETQTEIDRGMELLAPGPHCIIIVFSLSERVTADDIKRLEKFQSVFDVYLQKHALVVFTGMDEFEDEGQTLDEYKKGLPQQLKDFLNRLGTSPIGVAARHHTDINSSSQIIQAVKLTYEKLGNTFIDNFTIRKREGDTGCISIGGSNVARKNNASFDKRTVLLLGKSGIGKSSVGNVLLGEKKFKASMMEERGTKICQIEESDQLVVVDTPGFFSSIRSDVETAKDIIATLKEKLTSIHVVILVLSIDERFSGSEDEAWEYVTSLFGEKILDQLMYVFTGKDSLEDDDRQFIFPRNLPRRPYQILNCKGYSQKERGDLLEDINTRFNNPISPTMIDNAQLDHIKKTEMRRIDSNKVDGEAFRRAVYSRLGHDEAEGYFQRFYNWVYSIIDWWWV